jgi:thymidylate synthase
MKTIYGLADPRKIKIIKYVGSTALTLPERLGQHLSLKRYGGKKANARLVNWLRSLTVDPIIINLTVIEDISEKAWMAKFPVRQLCNALNNGRRHSRTLVEAWKDDRKRRNMLVNRSNKPWKAKDIQSTKCALRRIKNRNKPFTPIGDISTGTRLWHRVREIGPLSMDSAWLRLLCDVYYHGVKVCPRGKETKELINSQIIVKMDTPVLTVIERKLGYRFMCAEAAWILSGDNRVKTLAPYSKIISNFSDNGFNFFGAYGPPLKKQTDYLIRTLRKDPSTRQAVATIWRKNPKASKDIPCTLTCHFLIREKRLDLVVNMRSSDVYLGVPYDIFSFSMWAAYILLESKLDLTLGFLYQNAASRHIYKTDIENIEKCLNGMTLGFKYSPFDPKEFKNGKELINHLRSLADKKEISHAWLHELRKFQEK